MDIIDALLIIAIVAAANHWRGGGFILLPGETPTNGRTQLRRISYAAVVALLAANPYLGLVFFLVWLPGIGVPFGAAGKWNKAHLTEWEPLDRLSDWVFKMLMKSDPSLEKQAVWGIVWLTAWGLVFGALASGVSHNVWPMIFLTSAGVVCWATSNLIRAIGKTPTIAHTEWTYGAMQGAAVAAICLGW